VFKEVIRGPFFSQESRQSEGKLTAISDLKETLSHSWKTEDVAAHQICIMVSTDMNR
jgi:hypothetical protein